MGEVIEMGDWEHGRGCGCKDAVLRAYGALRSNGEPVAIALDAASIVYRYHHPEVQAGPATLTVIRWVASNRADATTAADP